VLSGQLPKESIMVCRSRLVVESGLAATLGPGPWLGAEGEERKLRQLTAGKTVE
jgi:hypothetical protein